MKSVAATKSQKYKNLRENSIHIERKAEAFSGFTRKMRQDIPEATRETQLPVLVSKFQKRYGQINAKSQKQLPELIKGQEIQTDTPLPDGLPVLVAF